MPDWLIIKTNHFAIIRVIRVRKKSHPALRAPLRRRGIVVTEQQRGIPLLRRVAESRGGNKNLWNSCQKKTKKPVPCQEPVYH